MIRVRPIQLPYVHKEMMRTPIFLRKVSSPVILNIRIVALILLNLLLIAVREPLSRFRLPSWFACCDVRQPVLLTEVPVWVSVFNDRLEDVLGDVVSFGLHRSMSEAEEKSRGIGTHIVKVEIFVPVDAVAIEWE